MEKYWGCGGISRKDDWIENVRMYDNPDIDIEEIW